ncbi:MAG: tRNA pseudouridine(38-40) synthase TruA [Planctomycetota bacterium]
MSTSSNPPPFHLGHYLESVSGEDESTSAPKARRIKLTLEYDGTDFKGWQVQSGERAGAATDASVRTVQGEVERALSTICLQPIRISGASRTDAGVHARGQTASLILPEGIKIPTSYLCMALNSNMPKDVSAIKAEEVEESFHAQRNALGKIYVYSIFSRRERSSMLRRDHWHMRFPVDPVAMQKAAAHLVGTHDFTSFATQLKLIQSKRVEEGRRELETVRTINRVEINACPHIPGRFMIEVEGSGFLYQMVRTIAGSLVDVGRGYRPPDWMAEALAAKDRRKAGPTAPALGLCLEKVLY